MAKIRNSIHLQDRMTPVFKSIIRSMDSTMKAMKRVDREANKGVQSKAYRKAEKDIKRANNQLKKMVNHTDQANNSMRRLSGSSKNVSRNMTILRSGGFNLVNLYAALYIFRTIKDVLSSIMSAPDEALSTRARFGLFNESKYSERQLYEQVYKTAIGTRTGIEETGNLATRILISGAMEGPGAAPGALKVTEIINKALIAGGGTAEENRRALLQLSQALASGFLQGDELRAIREQTPYLAKILAEGLGEAFPDFAGTTIGQLKELGGQGELTSARMIKAFLAMEKKVDEAFEKMPRTFGQAMTQIQSVWKYFLYMLNAGEGALAKINEKAWQFADYLSSDDGIQFLTELATGITIVTDGILFMIDSAVAGLNWLREHQEVAKAGFIALGTVAAIAGTTAFISWVAATWPVLLMIGLVGGFSYAMIQSGMTVGEVIGGMIGFFLFMGAVYWNVIVGIIAVTAKLFIAIYNLLQGGVALVKNALLFIRNLFVSIFLQLGAIIYDFIVDVNGMFYDLADDALGALELLAKGVDFIFGTNLANGVANWRSSLGGLRKQMEDAFSTEGLELLEDKVWDNTNWMDFDWAAIGLDTPDKFIKEHNLIKDPMEAWDAGMNFGKGIDSYLDNINFDMGLTDLEGMLSNWQLQTPKVNVDGGDLDSVGKIKSDVDISQEDLKLLKDIAAREYLVNLAQITPKADITFGDVRETADVNKIMEVLEDMVEEAFATSLIIPE